jgi:hypothetical protein
VCQRSQAINPTPVTTTLTAAHYPDTPARWFLWWLAALATHQRTQCFIGSRAWCLSAEKLFGSGEYPTIALLYYYKMHPTVALLYPVHSVGESTATECIHLYPPPCCNHRQTELQWVLLVCPARAASVIAAFTSAAAEGSATSLHSTSAHISIRLPNNNQHAFHG